MYAWLDLPRPPPPKTNPRASARASPSAGAACHMNLLYQARRGLGAQMAGGRRGGGQRSGCPWRANPALIVCVPRSCKGMTAPFFECCSTTAGGPWGAGQHVRHVRQRQWVPPGTPWAAKGEAPRVYVPAHVCMRAHVCVCVCARACRACCSHAQGAMHKRVRPGAKGAARVCGCACAYCG